MQNFSLTKLQIAWDKLNGACVLLISENTYEWNRRTGAMPFNFIHPKAEV